MLDESGPRRVVPRWRSSWVAATTPETIANKRGKSTDFSLAVQTAEAEFRADNSVPIASELMFVADQAGNSTLAKEAALSILSHEKSLSAASLISSAKRILNSNEILALDAENNNNNYIRKARAQLKQNYDNPILLIDLAHALTASGRAASAERFIRAAL